MGVTSLTVTGFPFRVVSTVNRNLTPGRLKGVSAQIITAGSQPADNFIRVILRKPHETGIPDRHVLIQGYIGEDSALSWDGDFPIGTDDQITVQLRSSNTSRANITVTTTDTTDRICGEERRKTEAAK